MVEYGTAAYWNKRYEKDFGKTFDWLGPYQTVRKLLNEQYQTADPFDSFGAAAAPPPPPPGPR